MLRPYYNLVSKNGKLDIIDTRIKRKDVVIATEKLIEFRNNTASSLTPHDSSSDNMILKLPPELRNRVYRFALPTSPTPFTESRAVRATPVSKLLRNLMRAQAADTGVSNSLIYRARDSGTSLLSLCKQITIEARSLMESYSVAYIPVLSSMKYEDLVANILKHGVSSLSPNQRTIFTAITTFSNVHIHLHINHLPCGRSDDLEPYVDTSNVCIYGRIRQLLIIYTCASASKFRRLEISSIKRTAIVHFDHLFSDWRHMHAMAGCYKFKHLTHIMGEDAATDWDIRYYVYADGQIKAQSWSEWDKRLTKEFECLREECERFPNINLTAEVYGELRWSLEGQVEGVTRRITPSSTLWPSWPDVVPWRRFERVRSDMAVSKEDDA